METVLAAAVVTRSNFTSTALPGWGGRCCSKEGVLPTGRRAPRARPFWGASHPLWAGPPLLSVTPEKRNTCRNQNLL